MANRHCRVRSCIIRCKAHCSTNSAESKHCCDHRTVRNDVARSVVTPELPSEVVLERCCAKLHNCTNNITEHTRLSQYVAVLSYVVVWKQYRRTHNISSAMFGSTPWWDGDFDVTRSVVTPNCFSKQDVAGAKIHSSANKYLLAPINATNLALLRRDVWLRNLDTNAMCTRTSIAIWERLNFLGMCLIWRHVNWRAGMILYLNKREPAIIGVPYLSRGV